MFNEIDIKKTLLDSKRPTATGAILHPLFTLVDNEKTMSYLEYS